MGREWEVRGHLAPGVAVPLPAAIRRVLWGLRLGRRQSAQYCCLIRLHNAGLVEPHTWPVLQQAC